MHCTLRGTLYGGKGLLSFLDISTTGINDGDQGGKYLRAPLRGMDIFLLPQASLWPFEGWEGCLWVFEVKMSPEAPDSLQKCQNGDEAVWCGILWSWPQVVLVVMVSISKAVLPYSA